MWMPSSIVKVEDTFIVDLSNKRQGDHKYFNQSSRAMF